VCGESTKGIAKREASIPCKGKSTEKKKKVEKGREKRGSMCGQATKGTVKVEEFTGRVEKESRGVLWQRGVRGSTSIRIKMVHKGDYSDIYRVQTVWREGMPHGRKQRIGGDFK